MSDIVPFSDIEKMAGVIAKSNLFGVKTADQAVALMLLAQAETCIQLRPCRNIILSKAVQL
jgi:hypothetical protein